MFRYCLQEKPIGNSSGTYKKQQLFQTKRNHGQFIPLMSLVKAEDFFGSSSAGTILLSKYLCKQERTCVTYINGSYCKQLSF
jgi:hypothetical protein